MTTHTSRSIHLDGVTHGKAPIPLAARVGPLLMSSAILGKDPGTDTLPADTADQIRHAFANLLAVLAKGGASLSDVVHLGVTVSDNALREAVNGEWLKLFPDPSDRPARHIVQSPLQHGMVIQLEVTAFCMSAKS